MLRLTAVALVLALLLPGVLPAADWSWFGRAGVGFAGEVGSVAVVGLGMYAYEAANNLHWDDEDLLGPELVGLLILLPGLPAATAGGVCWAGQVQGLEGRYWAAYLGGVAGIPLGIGLGTLGYGALSLSPYVGAPLLVAAVISPAFGATVGYDLSRSHATESGFWQERLILPAVAIVPMRRVGHERTTRIDAKLLAIRF